MRNRTNPILRPMDQSLQKAIIIIIWFCTWYTCILCVVFVFKCVDFEITCIHSTYYNIKRVRFLCLAPIIKFFFPLFMHFNSSILSPSSLLFSSIQIVVFDYRMCVKIIERKNIFGVAFCLVAFLFKLMQFHSVRFDDIWPHIYFEGTNSSLREYGFGRMNNLIAVYFFVVVLANIQKHSENKWGGFVFAHRT